MTIIHHGYKFNEGTTSTVFKIYKNDEKMTPGEQLNLFDTLLSGHIINMTEEQKNKFIKIFNSKTELIHKMKLIDKIVK